MSLLFAQPMLLPVYHRRQRQVPYFRQHNVFEDMFRSMERMERDMDAIFHSHDHFSHHINHPLLAHSRHPTPRQLTDRRPRSQTQLVNRQSAPQHNWPALASWEVPEVYVEEHVDHYAISAALPAGLDTDSVSVKLNRLHNGQLVLKVRGKQVVENKDEATGAYHYASSSFTRSVPLPEDATGTVSGQVQDGKLQIRADRTATSDEKPTAAEDEDTEMVPVAMAEDQKHLDQKQESTATAMETESPQDGLDHKHASNEAHNNTTAMSVEDEERELKEGSGDSADINAPVEEVTIYDVEEDDDDDFVYVA